MKKIILIIISITCLVWQTNACDVCGCKLGGVYFGILPMNNSHFVGLRYSQAAFKASISYGNSQYISNEFSSDTYHRVDLLGRYSISPKLQVSFMLPYLMNEMNGSHQQVQSNGMGDPMVLVHYNVLNTANNGVSFWQHSLLLGGGIKMPLGEYQKEDKGVIINRNFQLGSGSLDYLLSLNYTLRYQKTGVNVESAYKINTENSQSYRFGNQLNASAYLFQWIETPQIAFLPFAGVYYEQAAKHSNNTIEQLNTGGSALFGTFGLQVFRNNLSLNFLYQLPWQQNYYTDQLSDISAKDRFTVGLLYNFSLKKKSSKKVD